MSKGSAYPGTRAFSSMRHGGAPVAGAGIVKTGGPGAAAMKVKSNMSGTKFSVGSSSMPKGMKIQREGE